jgi:serine/threonine protein kinase/Tfp pilus assembly protein PilF
MDADRWQMLKVIFAAASELPVGERDAYVQGACGGDSALRAEIESLLELAHTEPRVGARPDALSAARPSPPGERPGDEIDRYRLIELIGEGGFGLVYAAEQQRPVVRKVALKIIRLGMDTRQVIARFEAERQALAIMDHPNIAKVFDAGATESGRPYFVMELVGGVAVTDYCDQANLGIRARLDLFVQICGALQHAHQKGIIHRDIKPSNVLVSEHDGRAVPKVIDFGIAKATNARLTERTMFTGFHQMIGTPAYMSPEQAGSLDADVDTRSDIYSLGVLLYELLTGTTPFDMMRLRSAAYEELQRIIREVEPPKPSTRLSALEALPSVAAHRNLEPRKLLQLIHGELDWIVMKALDKDRDRRYETASELATDVQRYLTDRPVEAGPPSRIYTLRKMVRRHRMAFITTAAVSAALAAATTISVVQAVRATRATKLAQDNAARADREADNARIEAAKQSAINEFLQDMLASTNPRLSTAHAPRGRNVTVLQALNVAASRLDTGTLKDQPEIEAAVRTTLGNTYHDLGEYAAAETHLRAALSIMQRLHGTDHQYVAMSLNNLAGLLQDRGKSAEAEPLFRQALEIGRKVLGDENRDTNAARSNLAALLTAQGKVAEAEGLYRQALRANRKLFGDASAEVATNLNNLGMLLQDEGQLSDAEAILREALAIRRKVLVAPHPNIATSLNNLALLLEAQGNLSEPEPMLREALAMRRQLFAQEHPTIASSLNNLGRLLMEKGALAEAEALFREALAMRRKLLGEDHPSVALSISSLGRALHEQGKLAEAEVMQREALAIYRKRFGNGHPDVAMSLNNLAGVLRDLGKVSEAESVFREALQIRRATLGKEHPGVAVSLYNLGRALQSQGKYAEAEPLFREALAIREKRLPNHWIRAETAGSLGEVLAQQNKLDEAEPLLLAGYEGIKDNPAAPAEPRRRAVERLVNLYQLQNKPEEAARWRARLPATSPAPASLPSTIPTPVPASRG